MAVAPPSSSITLRDLSGSTQTNRPVTIHRVFAQGAFTGCIQASVGGTPVTTQNNPRTTWPDGSVQSTVLSFVVPSITANGTVTVTFASSASCNNTGALTKTEILDAGATWAANLGAEIRTKNGATTLSANLRTMLSAWDGTDTGINGLGVRYWLKGPVVTQLIVEDKTTARAYDFGWVYSGGAWIEDPTYNSLHPIFVVTIWPGKSYVKVETILENCWLNELQDQYYDLDIRLGEPLAGSSPTTTWEGNASYLPKTGFTHFAQSRWHRGWWVGTAPGDLKVDLNFEYMIYSKIIASYDRTKAPTLTKINADKTNWDGLSTQKRTWGGEGLGVARMSQAGQTASDHIGLMPAWGIRYLYSMSNTSVGNQLLPVIFGAADQMGSFPAYFREGRNDTSKKYCATSCSGGLESNDAFGHWVSIEARPTFRTRSQTGVVAGDGYTIVGSRSVIDGAASPGTPAAQRMEVEDAHQPDMAYIAYLISGDWYYLDEMQAWVSWTLGYWGVANDVVGRNSSAGVYLGLQLRGQAWSMKTLAQAAVMSPTGTPEKQYFTGKVRNNISCFEGVWNLTDGAYYNQYQWSRCNDTSLVRIRGTNPLYQNYEYVGQEGQNARSLFVTNITAAAPMVVTTSAAHRLVTGYNVYIYARNVGQDAGPWNGCWTVTVINSTQFSLNGSDGTSGGTYDGSGAMATYRGNQTDGCQSNDLRASWQTGFWTTAMNQVRRLGFDTSRLLQASGTLMFTAMFGPDAQSDKRYYASGNYWAVFTPVDPAYVSGGPRIYYKFLQTYNDTWNAMTSGFKAAMITTDAAYGEQLGWSTTVGDASGYAHIQHATAAALQPYTIAGVDGSTVWAWFQTNMEQTNLLNDNPKWALVPDPSYDISSGGLLFSGSFLLTGISIQDFSGGFTWTTIITTWDGTTTTWEGT